MLCEMQSVSSRIWTRVAVSISYDDNDYTTGTDFWFIGSARFLCNFYSSRQFPLFISDVQELYIFLQGLFIRDVQGFNIFLQGLFIRDVQGFNIFLQGLFIRDV